MACLPAVAVPKLLQLTTQKWKLKTKRKTKLKKNPLLTDSSYDVQAQQHDILVANHRKGDRALTGVFSVRGEKALVVIDAPDGVYENLYDGSRVEVLRNRVPCVGKPIIIEWQAE